MSIKEKLEYLKFYIKNLSVNLVTDIKSVMEDQVQVEISLGFAEPNIIKEEGKSIAVFPYRLEFNSSNQVTITSEFAVGFILKSESLEDVDNLKLFVSENKNEFIKHITKAVNQIIDNALEHTNLRFEESFTITPIDYTNCI
ncbi:hypothetical protein ACFGXG_10195 [Pasteurella multocida]|nr:hypothetical protein [Pasteurella multocida]